MNLPASLTALDQEQIVEGNVFAAHMLRVGFDWPLDSLRGPCHVRSHVRWHAPSKDDKALRRCAVCTMSQWVYGVSKACQRNACHGPVGEGERAPHCPKLSAPA